MKFLIIAFAINFCTEITFSQSVTITKKRPADMELPGIKKIVIGDFVNATGLKDKNSLDLIDNITSKIFNSGRFEVVDRNILDQILSSQKRGSVEVIDEKTISLLSKKLDDAILILGRLQASEIRQDQITERNTIKCGTAYYWKVSGSMTVQLKMIDIKTGRLIFSNSVIQPIDFQSVVSCLPTAKFQDPYIEKQVIPDLASKITNLFIPYSEDINVFFQDGTIFKHPFKNLTNAISMVRIKDYEKAVELLQPYTQTSDLKNNFKAMAWYNYGLALFAVSRYSDAKKAFKQAISLYPSSDYQLMYDKMDNEKMIAERVSKTSG